MEVLEEKEKVKAQIRNKKLGKSTDNDDDSSKLSKAEIRKIKAQEAKKIRNLKTEIKKKKKIVYVSESDQDDDESSEEEIVVRKKKTATKKKKKIQFEEEDDEEDNVVDNRSHFQKSGLTAMEYQRFLGF